MLIYNVFYYYNSQHCVWPAEERVENQLRSSQLCGQGMCSQMAPCA